jgi:hypothetical protein
VNRVKSDLNLTTYTRQDVEARIAHEYMDYFGNHTQEVLQLFEDTYLPSGTADDDHLAWLQFRVDVSTILVRSDKKSDLRLGRQHISQGEHFEM